MVSFGIEVSLIHPDRVDFTALEKALRASMDRTAKYCLRAYRATTGRWKHQVSFVVERAYGAGSEYFGQTEHYNVRTYDPIYHMVDVGTEGVGIYGGKYVIQPRQLTNAQGRPTALRFQAGYNPSTRPGKLDSHGSERYGDDVYTPTVLHPGIRARRFTEIIAERAYKVLSRDLAKRVDEGFRQSLHPLVRV